MSVYVDDLIFTGNEEAMFKKFKSSMKQEFDMSDLGKMKYFLGVEVVQDRGILSTKRNMLLKYLKGLAWEIVIQ